MQPTTEKRRFSIELELQADIVGVLMPGESHEDFIAAAVRVAVEARHAAHAANAALPQDQHEIARARVPNDKQGKQISNNHAGRESDPRQAQRHY